MSFPTPRIDGRNPVSTHPSTIYQPSVPQWFTMQFVTIGNKICPGVEMFNHRCRNRQVIRGYSSAIADTSGVMILGDCPGNRYSPEAYNLTDGVAAQARLARDRALPSIETAFRLTIVHRLVHTRPQQQQQNNRAEGPRVTG